MSARAESDAAVDPQGCGRCGIPERGHARQVGADGSHTWVRPSDELVKARMLARVVARQGALPMPAGSQPLPMPAERLAEVVTGDTLPAWLYQRFMPDGEGWDRLDSGQREYWERQARAVRRAVERDGFKAAPDGITRRLAPTQALREDEPLVGRARLDASAARDAEATHWRRLEIEDPHDGPLHHTYRVPRDLPGLGGAE